MNKPLIFTILGASVIVALSIHAAGESGRYQAGDLGGSGIYILDSKTGDIRTCITAKLLKDNECQTLKEIQAR